MHDIGAKAIVVVAASLAAATQIQAQDRKVSIASWGGAYQHAQEEALYKPAREKTDFDIRVESFGGMADVKLQVATGSVTWDLAISSIAIMARAGKDGLLEPIDYDVVDVSNFLPNTYHDYCVGADTFSAIYAWNNETFGEDGPKSWADFWDVEKFPGPRAYRGAIGGALEPALMADGVPPEQVYQVLSSEEGIDRAINKIRELKPHIAVFWTSGAQQAQLLMDGEVELATGWNGRFDAGIAEGAPISYDYNQGILDVDCFSVPKGAPNVDGAMELLAEISKPEYQAALPQYITYGPTNKGAYDLDVIEEDLAKMLPSYPANAAIQLPVSPDWYIEWETLATEKYQAMLTE